MVFGQFIHEDKKRPTLSPKRQPVVYKTNLTNRQQKELLSVRCKDIKFYLKSKGFH